MCVFWFFYHTHTHTLQREHKNSSLCILYLRGLKSHLNWPQSLIKTFKRFSLKSSLISNSEAPILWFLLLKTLQIIEIMKFLWSAIFRTPHTWYLPTRTHSTHSLQNCLAHPVRTLCAHPHSVPVCYAHSHKKVLKNWLSKRGELICWAKGLL